ncbi:hypothetical protein [Bacillus sp. BA3]|uniref:hypothetical protein n=1 Tax=Bacillus sp. BA3 TaxID=2057910 RepID=UPI0019207113|nr:hypothetical protein [Bacillus sp. BA3]
MGTPWEALAWAVIIGLVWGIVIAVSPWQSSRYLMAKNEHVAIRAGVWATISILANDDDSKPCRDNIHCCPNEYLFRRGDIRLNGGDCRYADMEKQINVLLHYDIGAIKENHVSSGTYSPNKKKN